MSDFRNWLLRQRDRDDPIGAFAVNVYNNKEWDGKQATLKRILSGDMLKAFDRALAEFRSRPPSPRNSARGPYLLEFREFHRTFQTKNELTEYYKQIKDTHHNQMLDEETRDAVLALFQWHPHVMVNEDEPQSISVKLHIEDGNFCFHIDDEPHSYVRAIALVGHTDSSEIMQKYKIAKFIKVGRMLITDQIHAQNADSFEQVDHVIFFTHLLYDWACTIDLRISNVSFVGTGSATKFSDDKLNESWIEYHSEHAILRCIPAKENACRKPANVDWTFLY